MSCWKVLDSILLIWLCCRPLSRNTHTHTYKMCNPSFETFACVRWCRGLNYSHLLQRRAAVKTGQMLYLVVGQLPVTIHKAHKQWPAVDYSVGNHGPDEVIWVCVQLCECDRTIVWWVIGCHSKVKCFGAQSVSLSGGVLPLLFPPSCMSTYRTLRRGSCSHRSGGRAESPARVSVL